MKKTIHALAIALAAAMIALPSIVMAIIIRDQSAANVELLHDARELSQVNARIWKENIDLTEALKIEARTRCLNSPVIGQ